MTTIARFGISAVIMACAGLIPATAQVPVEDLGAALEAHNPYTPPPCVAGVPFADVTCSTFYDAWIEQFAADGITAGCGGGNYCPNENVTRAQMAVFIEAAMHGTANWSPGDLGNNNTGLGAVSLYSNTMGSYNTGLGAGSLYSNLGGDQNTAVGGSSLVSNTTGSNNTSLGTNTLYSNITGSGNTAIGVAADVASGNLSNATALGYQAVADASNHVRIGNGSVTQIGGQVAWSNLSDLRMKTNIANLDLGLDFVMALRPVSFTLKQGNRRTDLGFIAQDVEALLGDSYNLLGIGADNARTLSLRYTDFIAPLVKAIQEQQAQIDQQRSEIESQKADLAALKGEMQALLAARADTMTSAPR
jgi:hypothetical protein